MTPSITAVPTATTPTLDDLLDAWRDARVCASEAHDAWRDAGPDTRREAYAVYLAAADREEAAERCCRATMAAGAL